MPSFQPHPSTFLLLLLLINPALALSQNDSLKIALGISLGVIVVMMTALGTLLYIRYRAKKKMKNVLGNTFHPRFGDTSISAPERGWNYLSPIRSDYPKNPQPGKKPPGFNRLLDPETTPDVEGLQELKDIPLSPSLASSTPSPPAATYSRSSPPSWPQIPLQLPAEPTNQDKPFVLATDLSSKKAHRASPKQSQQRLPDQHRPKPSSQTFPPSIPAPNSDSGTSDLDKFPGPSHDNPSEQDPTSKSLVSTLLPTRRRNTSPSPARASLPSAASTAPVLYKPVSESYIADLSRMSTEHQNHYGYPTNSPPTTNPPAAASSQRNRQRSTSRDYRQRSTSRDYRQRSTSRDYRQRSTSRDYRQRSTSRGSRTRSRDRDVANHSGSTDPPFPRHPAHQRRTSDTSTVYEVDTSDERGFMVGEEDLYG